MPDEDPSKRAIRSFVRRGGRLTPSQRQGIDAYWPLYGIEFQRGLPALPGGFKILSGEVP
jgi:tRNA G46 methylase TrmB